MKPIAFFKENGKDIPVYLNPNVSRHEAIQNIIALYRSEWYFQSEEEITACLNELSEDDRESLCNGYVINVKECRGINYKE